MSLGSCVGNLLERLGGDLGCLGDPLEASWGSLEGPEASSIMALLVLMVPCGSPGGLSEVSWESLGIS